MRPTPGLLEQAIELHENGDLVEAERLLKKILGTDPRNFLALQHLGIIHSGQGRFHEAERIFLGAVELEPMSAEAHNNLGRVQGWLGQSDRAIASFRRALALNPRIAEAEFNLGTLHLKEVQPDAAIACFRNALRIRPDFTEALCALAGALNQVGRAEEATALLHQAIEARPREAATHHALGVLHVELGDLEQARFSFERAIALKPAWPVLYYDLSRIHRFEVGDRHLLAMEALLGKAAVLGIEGRIALYMALQKAYADLGRYDDAFGCLAAGNEIRRGSVQYDENRWQKRVENVRQVFNREFISTKAGQGYPSGVPIFVVGFPRSGTTLIEQILASHPGVHGAGELTYLVELISALRSGSSRDVRYPECVADFGAEEFARLGAAYEARLHRLAPAAVHVTDKLPINYLHLGFIHLILPRAKVIHVQRNAMDTCLSCFENEFGSRLTYTCDLGELGRNYRRYRETMQHWRSVLPAGAMLEVKYEDVVGDFEPQVRRILQYCELAWDNRCLSFHETDRPMFTQSQVQARRPLYHSSIERWRHYERHLGPLVDALGPREGSPADQRNG